MLPMGELRAKHSVMTGPGAQTTARSAGPALRFLSVGWRSALILAGASMKLQRSFGGQEGKGLAKGLQNIATRRSALGFVAGLVANVPPTGRAYSGYERITVDFTANGIGVPPSDFEFWQTGGGAPGQWFVVRDPSARNGAAIEQSSTDTLDGRFPLAIYRPISVKDVEASARFKLLSGTLQTAGIAARLRSPHSYYVAVANALEKRVDLFDCNQGKLKRIAGVDAEVNHRQWHMLTLRAVGNELSVSLDGGLLLAVQDTRLPHDGRIALWTEEDNVTRFDEITIMSIPPSQGK